jgi:uncharacterized tellurite resistance protein B-like protein
MSAPTKLTKAQLVKLIDDLERTPEDKGRILGDVGITAIGAGLGAAAVGTVAAAVGATSIFGVTSAAGWLGLTVVAATPVGWVLGGAAAAGAAAYTVSRLIRNGGMSEGKKAELLNRYREEARKIAIKEAAGNIADCDRTSFIVALRELISKDVIPPDVAFRFIEQVESGGLPISQAFALISEFLSEVELGTKHAGTGSATDTTPKATEKIEMASSNPADDARPEDVERVVKDEMRFKAKLAIGEDAYAELRNANAVRKYWDLFGAVGGGAAVAKSSIVATTFFAPHGVLGLVGLGTAVTPVGWVIAAAALSGGAWFGVMHALGGATGSRVTVIPKCINTPLDIIGTKLFDLMMPLALKVAQADGHISDQERQCIRSYFADQWGYDTTFVEAGIALIEPRLDQFKITGVADELVAYKKSNPDCNYAVMSRDLVVFLREVMESDGVVDEREELVLKRVEGIFSEAAKNSFGETISGFKDGLTSKFKSGAQAVASGAQTVGSSAVAKADSIAKSEAFGNLKGGVEKGAVVASDSIRIATDRAAKAIAAFSTRFKK